MAGRLPLRGLRYRAGGRGLAGIALIAAAYYGSAKLGLTFAFATASVTAIWPPTGIALAALVLWGPPVLAGRGPRCVPGERVDRGAAGTAIGISAGTRWRRSSGRTCCAGSRTSCRRWSACATCSRWWHSRRAVSTAIAATIGVGSLVAADEVSVDDFASVWRVWWLGDMGGDLLVAPVILVAAT